jgi:hypothetical protein
MTPSTLPPQPGPSWTTDAVVQSYLNFMQTQLAQQNGQLIQQYNFQLQNWQANNARGIYNPAPAGVQIAILNQTAAIETEMGNSVEASQQVYYSTYYEVAPGTVAQPPAVTTPTPLPVPANPLGGTIPGVPNMRSVAQGAVVTIGETYADASGVEWVVIPEGPMGGMLWMVQPKTS